MAFRANEYQQTSLFDRYDSLSKREKRFMEKSWAKTFADYVFPSIDENRFAVLYSNNSATRPNTPVNIIVGSLMIKTMFGQTDDEILRSILFDIQYQVALHTTCYKEQPIGDRTFSRFRERLYNHQILTGEDLLGDEMKHLASVYAEFLKLNSNIKRMDSMMIASNSKRMSRLEIVYTVNANAVRLLNQTGNAHLILKELEHYLVEDDMNNVIYHCKDEDSSIRLDTVIKEAAKLKEIMSDDIWLETDQYRLLLRVLEEQANFDSDGNYTAKPKAEISSSSLQNPSDPDATFRKKAGKDHKGYIGNFVETIGENGASLITDFDFKQNTYSDSAFAKDQILQHDKEGQEETYIADGAYGGTENQKLAEEHGINLVTTALTGKMPSEIFADFQFNEDGTEVLKCPAGYKPEKSTYHNSTESVRLLMSKCHCENCPHRKECKAREQKHNFVVNTSKKMSQRSAYIRLLSTDEYIKLARMRNAIEGIPSVLRRRFGVDNCPHFGQIKTGWAYELAVGAFNFIKLTNHLPRVREMSIHLTATS